MFVRTELRQNRKPKTVRKFHSTFGRRVSGRWRIMVIGLGYKKETEEPAINYARWARRQIKSALPFIDDC